MPENRIGRRTLRFPRAPRIAGFAAAVGKKEREGPLGPHFDAAAENDLLGKTSWEQAESELQQRAISLAAKKANYSVGQMQSIFAGDLLNQCIASAFASVCSGAPYLGQYGACSTMAQTLLLGACLCDGGYAAPVACAASSHFCSAERQYRFPLAYGGQRTPTAQWTATAAGAVILSDEAPSALAVTAGAIGQMVDMGVTDAANMGAAMAPAAYRTLTDFWRDTGTAPTDYDLVVTGDLGNIGSELLVQLFQRDGVDITPVYHDCGNMLFSPAQDAHAGASGCGCSACVLCGPLLREMEQGKLRRLLFTATGALMSPVSVQQGLPIAGICHAVLIERMGPT